MSEQEDDMSGLMKQFEELSKDPNLTIISEIIYSWEDLEKMYGTEYVLEMKNKLINQKEKENE